MNIQDQSNKIRIITERTCLRAGIDKVSIINNMVENVSPLFSYSPRLEREKPSKHNQKYFTIKEYIQKHLPISETSKFQKLVKAANSGDFAQYRKIRAAM